MLPLASEKGLTIKTAGTPHDFTVTADPEKLERIVQNIVSNAIKFTEKGSVRIDYGPDKKGFFIEITDSGIGIPSEKTGDIFKRFYRGEESRGIGLGLSIVKELLDAMGGTITVKSADGKGAAFRIWLPQDRQL
jgi:two-component system phosphate regulon sensor histidine kinase PhoR